MPQPIADTVLGSGLGAGFGMTWIGLCYVLFDGRLRLPAAVAGGLGVAVGFSAILDPLYVPIAVALLAASSALVFGGPALAHRGLRVFTRPAVRWAAAALLGLASAAGSGAYYDYQINSESDEVLSLAALLERNPELAPYTGPTLTTDRGTVIPARVPAAPRTNKDISNMEKEMIGRSEISRGLISTGPADDRFNCHGWVFAAGQVWIGGSSVDTILNDNGYRRVNNPQPGDVVVFRKGRSVEHTAVVRYCSPNAPPLVEGKWGCMGVYLHRPDSSGYGESFEYYRSPRPNHTLRGALTAGSVLNE